MLAEGEFAVKIEPQVLKRRGRLLPCVVLLPQVQRCPGRPFPGEMAQLRLLVLYGEFTLRNSRSVFLV